VPWHASPMSEATPETLRSIELTRIGERRYKATNVRGGVLPIGTGEDPDFTPIELLLAALAGCSAVDVDLITGKRAQPTSFDVHAEGHKVRDDLGNHVTGMRIVFDLEFPEGEAGDAARAVLPRTLEQVRDRLCPVVRTVALPNEVDLLAADAD